MNDERDRIGSLSERQEAFCQYYLIDCNAAEAARRAGYNERRAKQQGYELMRMPAVLDRIRSLQAERAARVGITQLDVLQEIAIISRSNIDDYLIDGDGRVRLAEGVPAHMMRAVSSVKRRVRHTSDGERIVETEIRLWDKVGSLRLAAQHLGMLKEHHEVKHTGAVRFLPPTTPPDAAASPEAGDA